MLPERAVEEHGRLDSLYYPTVGTSRPRVRHTYNASGYLTLVREFANGAWGRTFWTSTTP